MEKNIAWLTVLSAVFFLAFCSSEGTAKSAYENADPLASEASPVAVTKEGDITDYESAGNLEATNPLDCVPAIEVLNTSSAADVVAGAVACVELEKFDEAADLVMVSSAFALFDTQRVADETAHSALQALYSEAFGNLPEADRTRLNESINELDSDNVRAQSTCEYLAGAEPPSYFPGYMIAHGLGALTGELQEPLVEDFDEDAAWDKALDFINCNG